MAFAIGKIVQNNESVFVQNTEIHRRRNILVDTEKKV